MLPLFACHLKTKTNLLRLIYSRRVVDEMPVDQFIFKRFPPRTYASSYSRESFASRCFSHRGNRTNILSAFRSWHVSRRLGTSRWLATSLIMLRNSDICARPHRNANVIRASHETSLRNMRMPELIRSNRVSVASFVRLACLNYNVRANANANLQKKERPY